MIRLLPIAAIGLFALAAAPAQEPAQEPAPGEKAPVEASAPAGPAFLWQIQGKGTVGYVFGTIHLPDDRVLALPKQVDAAFREADYFFAEIEATEASQAEIQGHAMLPAGTTLVEVLGNETWGRVAARLRSKGVPGYYVTALQGMQPWAMNALLPMLDYFEEQAAGKAPLDKSLYDRAVKEKKIVGGLETVKEQVDVFTAFTREEQVRMLRDALDTLDEYDAKGRNIMEETVTAWLSGDEKKLMQLLEDGFGKDPELRVRAENGLLWERNHRLAVRIDRELRAAPDKIGFFAVGALHLPDPERAEKPDRAAAAEGDASSESVDKTAEIDKRGIISLLREQGYAVTRVGAAAPAPAGAGR